MWLDDWEWENALTEFKRSLELNPTYPTANHWYAEYAMTIGRHEEAMVRIKKSQDLDPLSLIISVAVGWALYFARRYDEAIEQLRRTIDLDSNYPVTYWILGLLLRKTGCYEVAVTEGEKGVKLSGGSPLMRAALAHTLGAAGRAEEARQILDELTTLAKQKSMAFTSLPEFILAWENTNARWNTCRNATKNIPTGSSIFIWIRAWMVCGDPRFQDLLRQIGFPR